MFDNRCDNKSINNFSICQQIDKKSFQNDNLLIEINKMPTEDYKKRVTQEFIKNVETVISKGLAKNHAEIIDKMDWDAGAFSNVMNGRRNAPPEKAEKLKEVFNLSTSYREQRLNHKLNHSKDADIEVYQAGTKGSFIDLYEDENTSESIGSLNSSVFPGCNLALRVTGSSMYPMIVNQSIIVGERITDVKGISSGEIYAVHNKQGLRTCKYVHLLDSKPGFIKLVALNKNVPPQTIALDDNITLIMRVYFIINPS
jgi:phage repressor protein C with HTH and peptisase S24 domain